jgi:2-keto-4-pentenoate hydratase
MTIGPDSVCRQRPSLRHLVLLAAVSVLGLGLACATPKSVEVRRSFSDELGATQSEEVVAKHLLVAKRSGQTTSALSDRYASLDVESAYRIQKDIMNQESSPTNTRVGWKLAGTQARQGRETTPSYGYILQSNLISDGHISGKCFAGDEHFLEAEIVFYIGRDLPGPTISRESLGRSITWVGSAVELVSPRVVASRNNQRTLPHLIAENLGHVAVFLGANRAPFSTVPLEREAVNVVVNGQHAASGDTTHFMNGSPFEAVLWLANELPSRGMFLKKGEFVISGTMINNPPIGSGDNIAAQFSSLGSISIKIDPPGNPACTIYGGE